jgi:hypothetical protein
MRTDVELLKLLLRQVKKDFSYFQWLKKYYASGLCVTISDMRIHCIINNNELHKLYYLIGDNKPKNTGRVYWWPPGKKYPRVRFLKKLIKKLS